MTTCLARSSWGRPRNAPRAVVVAIAGLLAVASGRADAGLVNTAVYSSYTDNFPNGVHFTGTPVDNLSTPDFDQFGAAVSWDWHPDGLKTFAADTLGYIQASKADSFTFILAGAQQSYAFVDGVLTVSHGSDAVAQNQNTIPLSAGLHSIEVQYDIVKPADQFPADTASGYELTISPANEFSIVPAPEPADIAMLVALGAAGLSRRGRPARR
jgi:hypothetical protein